MPCEQRLLRIGVLITPTDPFWVQVSQFVAEELGPRLVLIDGENTNWRMSAEDLADFQDELLALELDAFIGLNLPSDFLCQLVERGIPVISLDEAFIEYPGFTSLTNWELTGRMIGEFLAEKMGGRGHIVCVKGEEGSMDYNLSRVEGLKEGIASHPDMTVEYFHTYWPYDKAIEDLSIQFTAIKAKPDAIFGLSDSLALAAMQVASKFGLLKEDTLIVGINGDPLALAAIAEGSLAATVHVMTKDIARQAAKLAVKAAEGEPLPHYIDIHPILVTKENVNQVANQKLMDIAMIPSKLVGYNRQADQSRLKQLEISLAFIQRMGSLLNPAQLLGEITHLILENYEFDQVYFFYWAESQRQFSINRWNDSSTPNQTLSLDDSGLLADVLVQNKPIFILDAIDSRRYPKDVNCPEVQSRCLFPVRFGERLIGVLDLRGNHPARVRRLDLMGLQVLAEQMGVALQNAELFAEAVEARAAAEKADQLKTRLLANVSHELRAPLNVILGYTRVALNTPNPYNLVLPDQLISDLEHVYTSGEHLIRLINDLLDLSRAEIGELELFPETIETRSFLEDVFQSMANTDILTKDVHWELSLPEKLPVIQADPVRLRQVLLNLFSNARKFTLAGKIILGAEVSPPYLHFWVEDTGTGIPLEQQELIFQPFVSIERYHQRPQGIGLGLSVTRRLVALHSGTITLDSQPGRGSIFHVFLPLPTYSGQQIVIQPFPTHATLLILSGRKEPSAELLMISQRMNWKLYHLDSQSDIELVLKETNPCALYWEVDPRSSQEWPFVQRLCSYPQMAAVPLLLYGVNSPSMGDKNNGMTGIMPKPFNHQKLTDTLNALCPVNVEGTILIVDDDLQSRTLYHQLIQKSLPGYAVIESGDGVDALKILETHLPDLILLDLVMPGLDGFTVLESIRSNLATRHLPVMIISGKALTKADIGRLDYARVTVQSKHLLTPQELNERLRLVFTEGANLPQPTSRVVKMAISEIHQSYQTAMTRHTLAVEVGVTETYFSKIFHQEVGLSPWEYLTRYRVNRAKELLTTSESGMNLIARLVGFGDPAYFSRVFHKYTGLSPLAYRKQGKTQLTPLENNI